MRKRINADEKFVVSLWRKFANLLMMDINL